VTDYRNQAPYAPPTDGRRRPGWIVIALVAILVLVVGIGVYWFLTQGPGNRIVSPAGSDITEFNGEGDQTTDAFEVRGQWQVHWENSGASFAFAINGDQDLGTIVQQEGPGSGVTSVVAGGIFHLEITAEGPWEIRIAQGE
jgi:hypothetical protein